MTTTKLAAPAGLEPLDGRLAALLEAVEAARSIGLEEEAAAARAVARRIGRRATLGGSVYVMALAGGTGVGKSSVLNALAGREVSPVRAVRPTTDRPVAYVAAARMDEVGPLLEWLKVASVATHEEDRLDDVAILDLPDVDSIRPEHRALVDALLPRIDAVTWVVDPEKYDDARAHDYWRGLALHADRLRFVINKSDLLTDADRRVVVEDLRRRLVADGIPRPVISVVSAASGEGIDALRSDLEEAAHAKVIVSAKLEADRGLAAERLAAAAGIEPDVGYEPLLPPRRRKELGREAVEGALSLVDPDGVAEQVRREVLYNARAGGGSLLGRALAFAGTMSGQRRRRGDPPAYLRDWRTRGALGRILNPVRAVQVEAANAVPPSSRRRMLASLGAPAIERELGQLLDRITRTEAERLEPPTSPLWRVIGALQLVVGAVVLFALAWMVILFVAGGGLTVGTADLPVLGPIPMPLALLAAGILFSALLGWLLGLHAGWIGRRVARQVHDRVTAEVRTSVLEDAFAGLDRVEQARVVIARSVQ